MNIELLKEKSAWLRRELFEMVVRTRKGHFPSSSSCAEIVVALYYGGYLRHDPKAPRAADRDRLFISKGQAGMVLYPILADLGYVAKEELLKFARADGVFRLYPDPSIPGIEAITGSLGHGIGIAAGHALSAKRDGKKFRNFVILSDGECYEGSVWETALFAAHHGLNNLIVVIDRNGCCILDHTEKCLRLDPLDEKWKAFGWRVRAVNGHSYAEVTSALDEAVSGSTEQPLAIISHSVKGKGVSFMEDQPGWHNRMPDDAQIARARKDLSTNCIVN
ncbi:MAG: transketolase [Verrucomicrobia bacterium]|nr:transketolase [Verrucomicrobiota bacterium]